MRDILIVMNVLRKYNTAVTRASLGQTCLPTGHADGIFQSFLQRNI